MVRCWCSKQLICTAICFASFTLSLVFVIMTLVVTAGVEDNQSQKAFTLIVVFGTISLAGFCLGIFTCCEYVCPECKTREYDPII